jgi:hypothetical protein
LYAGLGVGGGVGAGIITGAVIMLDLQSEGDREVIWILS